MSQPDVTESTRFSDNPCLEYGTIQQDSGGNSEDGIQLDQETAEEARRKFNRNRKELGWALVLYPAAIITRQLLTNAWNSWCVVLIIVLATGIEAQDLENTETNSDIPTQVLAGMDMSHGSYRLDAFDCDEPEDIITQSIPESCSADTAEEKELEERQEYTILQKVPTFEYPATLCTLRRSRHYYDCVWAFHIRIAAPTKIYAQEVLRIEECMTEHPPRRHLKYLQLKRESSSEERQCYSSVTICFW